MTDIHPLLRGVLESPLETAPRMVYADHLEENGQAGLAEFIRLDINGDHRQRDRPAANLFEKYVRPVWNTDWLYVLRNSWHYDRGDYDTIYPRKVLARVHDGMVQSVRCTCQAFLKHAQELFAAHPITDVVLIDRAPDLVASNNGWFWQPEPDDDEFEVGHGHEWWSQEQPSRALPYKLYDRVMGLRDKNVAEGTGDCMTWLSWACQCLGLERAGVKRSAKLGRRHGNTNDRP
jgi:uncharacterized protein (TIGR02996 family)